MKLFTLISMGILTLLLAACSQAQVEPVEDDVVTDDVSYEDTADTEVVTEDGVEDEELSDDASEEVVDETEGETSLADSADVWSGTWKESDIESTFTITDSSETEATVMYSWAGSDDMADGSYQLVARVNNGNVLTWQDGNATYTFTVGEKTIVGVKTEDGVEVDNIEMK